MYALAGRFQVLKRRGVVGVRDESEPAHRRVSGKMPEEMLRRVVLVSAGSAEAAPYLRGHELSEGRAHGAHMRHY